MTDHEILKALKSIVESRAVTGGTLGTLLDIIAELEDREAVADWASSGG